MSLLKECFELRVQRLALQRQVDDLEQKEKDILYEIQKQMSTSCVSNLQQGSFIAKMKTSDEPLPENWPAILQYIRDSGSTDLLQKRLTVSAVKARWDVGVDIPGVSKVVKHAVTIEQE